MKWVAVAWLFFCLTAHNRNPIVERIAIVHSLIATYVVWGLFTSDWNLNDIESINHSNIVLAGAIALVVMSLFSGLMMIRDRDDRFKPFAQASALSRHRQVGYVCLFGGILLIGLAGYEIKYFWPLPIIPMALNYKLYS